MADQSANGTIRKYLDALSAGDLEAVLALFAEDGDVVSPLYGTVGARQFFTGLFAVTDASTLTLRTIFAGVDDDRDIAVAFDYDWELANGEHVTFPVVDTFRLNDDGRFARMVIHYDASEARRAINA